MPVGPVQDAAGNLRADPPYATETEQMVLVAGPRAEQQAGAGDQEDLGGIPRPDLVSEAGGACQSFDGKDLRRLLGAVGDNSLRPGGTEGPTDGGAVALEFGMGQVVMEGPSLLATCTAMETCTSGDDGWRPAGQCHVDRDRRFVMTPRACMGIWWLWFWPWRVMGLRRAWRMCQLHRSWIGPSL